MDFQWDEEQEMLRQTVRSFAEKELRPIAFTTKAEGTIPGIYKRWPRWGCWE